MKIFEIKSNLIHNGTTFSKGQVAAFDIDSVQVLVTDGVLRELPVETIVDGEDFLAKEAKAKIADEENTAVVDESKDTWSPKESEQDTWASKEEKENTSTEVEETKEGEESDKVEEKTTTDEVKTEEVINSDKVEDGANL